MNGLTVSIKSNWTEFVIQHVGLHLYRVTHKSAWDAVEVSHNDLLEIAESVHYMADIAERMNANGTRVEFSIPTSAGTSLTMEPRGQKGWLLLVGFATSPYRKVVGFRQPRALATAINAITSEVAL